MIRVLTTLTCLVGLLAPASAASSSTVMLDCNGNGIDDSVDIATGSPSDANLNGIPDECELARPRISRIR